MEYFLFNDTAPTEIYTLSLHDALPILPTPSLFASGPLPSAMKQTGRTHEVKFLVPGWAVAPALDVARTYLDPDPHADRSEEHTSELQSRQYLVCRLLLEKKHTNPRYKY